MKIINQGRDKKTGLTRYFIDQPVWLSGKKAGTHIHRIALGSEALARKIAEIKTLSGSSLTKTTFGEGLDIVTAENNGAGMMNVYNRLKLELGKYSIDDHFPGRFWALIDKLRADGRAENTLSNYKSCVSHTLRRMEARGLIQNIPIKDFQIERNFRARIWTEDERKRIYAAMREADSHLYWSVYFSERNPIRCRSDLWTLTRDNLITAGKNAPYIRFQPKKTETRHPGPTTLPTIDDELLEYWERLFFTFPDCPLLFPRILKHKGKPYAWNPMGCPLRHWRWLCDAKRANVPDFRFHDLRHVAITTMLKMGWTRDQLKKLGIQYTDRAISVYDHTTADDVLAAGPTGWKSKGNKNGEVLCIASS